MKTLSTLLLSLALVACTDDNPFEVVPVPKTDPETIVVPEPEPIVVPIEHIDLGEPEPKPEPIVEVFVPDVATVLYAHEEWVLLDTHRRPQLHTYLTVELVWEALPDHVYTLRRDDHIINAGPMTSPHTETFLFTEGLSTVSPEDMPNLYMIACIEDQCVETDRIELRL